MLVGLLKTILILVAVYYIVTLLNRYFLKRYLYNLHRKQERDIKKNEGRVTVNDHPERKKRISPDEGEYVDYEEIDD
ncbi:MAG: hypothetical protein ACP5D1_05575 [Bacteroidales bacterium]